MTISAVSEGTPYLVAGLLQVTEVFSFQQGPTESPMKQ